MRIYITKFILVCTLFSSVCFADEYNFPDPYPMVYEEVKVLPFNCYGWTVHKEFFDSLFAKRTFHTVIEVGVFLGNWTISIAEKLPPGSHFFAVDHWKGSEEHFVENSSVKTLIPTLYQQFLSNVIHKKLTDKVIPVRMKSLDAAKKFAQLQIKADLIYIDAAHDYISVLRDLYAWYPRLAPKGVFCGDDWNCGGVRLAVEHFAAKKGLKISIHGACWQLEP